MLSLLQEETYSYGNDVPAARIPYISQEIWDEVIDWLSSLTLCDEYKHDVKPLFSCASVCKAWHTTARWCLLKDTRIIRSKGMASFYAKLVQNSQNPLPLTAMRTSITVSGFSLDEWYREPIPHLSVLITMLAGLCPQVKDLAIMNASWRVKDIHPHFFFHLSSFTSIKHLELASITFPTTAIFSRLICALPNLKELKCDKLQFARTDAIRIAFRTRPSLEFLVFVVDYRDIRIPRRAILWSLVANNLVQYLSHVELGYLSFEELRDPEIGALLSAAGQSLRHLSLHILADTEGSDIHPGGLSASTDLESVELKVDVSAHTSSVMPGIFGQLSSRRITTFKIEFLPSWYSQINESFMWDFVAHIGPVIDENLSCSQYAELQEVYIPFHDFHWGTNGENPISTEMITSMPRLMERGILKC